MPDRTHSRTTVAGDDLTTASGIIDVGEDDFDAVEGESDSTRLGPTPFNPMQRLGDHAVGSARWMECARQGARETVQEMARTYIQLGAYLHAIASTYVDDDPMKGRIYEAWGYTTFYEYCEKDLGLRSRKVDFLRSIYETLYEELRDMDTKLRDRIVALDYSKVREMVSVLTLGNAQEWYNAARVLPYDRFSRAVADYRRRCREATAQASPGELAAAAATITRDPGKRGRRDTAVAVVLGGAKVDPRVSIEAAKAPSLEGTPMTPVLDQDAPRHKKLFALYDDQYELVQAALKAASGISGSDKPGNLLTLICMDYLATNGAAPPGSEAFVGYVSNLEQVLQVDFIAIDRTGSRAHILYGEEHLVRLANDGGEDTAEEENDDE